MITGRVWRSPRVSAPHWPQSWMRLMSQWSAPWGLMSPRSMRCVLQWSGTVMSPTAKIEKWPIHCKFGIMRHFHDYWLTAWPGGPRLCWPQRMRMGSGWVIISRPPWTFCPGSCSRSLWRLWPSSSNTQTRFLLRRHQLLHHHHHPLAWGVAGNMYGEYELENGFMLQFSSLVKRGKVWWKNIYEELDYYRHETSHIHI